MSERAAAYANNNYAHPAGSLEMLRERNDIARSLYVAEESRPIWDLGVLMACGIERFWMDLDVNVNIFGIRSSLAQERISPEFVVVAEKKA